MKLSAVGINLNTNNLRVVKNNSKNNNQTVQKSQNPILLNSYPVSFSRKWKEHTSWGASVNPDTKEVSFKLFTYPDVKSAKVTIEKKNGKVHTFELNNKQNGIFELEKPLSSKIASDGDSYFYTIEKSNGEIINVKDPYSYKQDELLGKSVIYDQSKYKWDDKDWFKKDNKNRISRLANRENGLAKLNDAKIFELNVATFSKDGNFQGVINKLDEIVENGFNAIEIMPVENTASFNWGYDGVDKLAVSKYLGGPDEFKKLVDMAHRKNLNVIIDMVPNHQGPDGSQLGITGPYIKGPNDFGDAYNYEGQDSTYVRDFMVNAALNWLNNYHCDGIRFDMTKYMQSDTAMKQIAAEINYHNPDAFLIAEDGRGGIKSDGENFWQDSTIKHDTRVMQKLRPYETASGKDEDFHADMINKMFSMGAQTNIARLGYDSEWDFNYFHVLKNNLYGDCNLDEFEQACRQGQDRVKYVMSHDEIGNYEGSRLIPKLVVPMLHMNENVILNDEDRARAVALSQLKKYDINQALQYVLFQKAQLVCEKLMIMYVKGELDKYENQGYQVFYDEVLKPLGIDNDAHMTPRKIKVMYDKAFSTFKMANALTYSQKGPKMVFQGDEEASLVPFRFFRQFDSIKEEPYLYTEKGYKPGTSALNESMSDSIEPKGEAIIYQDSYKKLMRDLNKVLSSNKAVTDGRIVNENTVKHHGSQVIALHFADDESGDEIYTITNFSDYKYPREDADRYYIKFPKGEWEEIINTDDEKYKGSGYVNKSHIYGDGVNNKPINLSNRATLIFKKVN